VYSKEIRQIFDIAFRADSHVMKNLAGKDFPKLDRARALDAGFGSLYWMEGVVTRVRDTHGGNGKLLIIARVNNDLLCNLAAVVELDDASGLDARFLRYTSVPGLSIAHPAILFDETSDLYWMATNLPRASTRQWNKAARQSLHITQFSSCEVDRSMLYLFYSTNQFDWIPAGVIDVQMGFNRHFSYPHMLVSGSSLYIVSRATSSFGFSSGIAGFYNNHNSNSIAFHRIRNFRRLALSTWANELGHYTELTRNHS